MASETTNAKRRGEEEEEQQTGTEVSTPVPKNLIFCFDGSGQQPSDAEQSPKPPEKDPDPEKDSEADGLSNVAKLHLLLGGDFDRSHALRDIKSKQISLYYSGVGTYGGPFRRKLNVLFGLKDVDSILSDALTDLRKLQKPGDRIFVIGFSRGAAIARRFCAEISKHEDLKDLKVEMLVAFDTVASLGMPDTSTTNRPSSDVVFENRKVAPSVVQALHCMSLDDKRRHFQPTLMNAEDRVTEVWFAGAHNDVGGSWYYDGLSDVVLEFVLDEFRRRDVGLTLLAANEVNVEEISKANKDVESLHLDDLEIKPDCCDISHEQRMTHFHYHRKVVVIRDDEIIQGGRAVVHYSVAKRIAGRPKTPYRPQSLLSQPHRILYADGTLKEFEGLNDHLHSLAQGETRTVPVDSSHHYNYTGLVLLQGEQYQFEPDRSQTWQDADIVCDAGGWERFYMFPFRFLKRQNGANWFSLIGAISRSDGAKKEERFEIGLGPVTYVPASTGEFVPFANDANRFYFNNEGSIDVKVTRLLEPRPQ